MAKRRSRDPSGRRGELTTRRSRRTYPVRSTTEPFLIFLRMILFSQHFHCENTHIIHVFLSMPTVCRRRRPYRKTIPIHLSTPQVRLSTDRLPWTAKLEESYTPGFDRRPGASTRPCLLALDQGIAPATSQRRLPAIRALQRNLPLKVAHCVGSRQVPVVARERKEHARPLWSACQVITYPGERGPTVASRFPLPIFRLAVL